MINESQRAAIWPSHWTVAAAALLLVACSSSGGDGVVSPTDGNGLTNLLTVKLGVADATVVFGDPPPASGEPDAPVAKALETELIVEEGIEATLTVPLSFETATSILSVFAKINNANAYFSVSTGEVEALAAKSSAFPDDVTYALVLEVPGAIGRGRFCLDISGLDDQDQRSNAEEVCVNVVAQQAPPSDDQPSAEEVVSELTGTWSVPSDCVADGSTSSRPVYQFSGSGSFTVSVEIWSDPDCPGFPDDSSFAFDGSFAVGESQYIPQARRWAREIDFTVSASSNAPFLANCFNLISFDTELNKFVLGLPTVASQTNDDPQKPGSCRSAGTRPAYLSTAVEFVRQLGLASLSSTSRASRS